MLSLLQTYYKRPEIRSQGIHNWSTPGADCVPSEHRALALIPQHCIKPDFRHTHTFNHSHSREKNECVCSVRCQLSLLLHSTGTQTKGWTGSCASICNHDNPHSHATGQAVLDRTSLDSAPWKNTQVRLLPQSTWWHGAQVTETKQLYRQCGPAAKTLLVLSCLMTLTIYRTLEPSCCKHL